MKTEQTQHDLAKPEGEAEGASDARTPLPCPFCGSITIGKFVKGPCVCWECVGCGVRICRKTEREASQLWNQRVQGSAARTDAAPSPQPPPKSESPSDTQQTRILWKTLGQLLIPPWKIEGVEIQYDIGSESIADMVCDAINSHIRSLPSPWIATEKK